jgi:ribonuclease HII
MIANKIIVGIDEVGRGCWAGPLVAGAVILPAGFVVPKAAVWRLDDSKKLNRTAREESDVEIRQIALAIGLGWVTANEIDTVGLTQAVRLAMQRALDMITAEYDEIIIDGSFNFLADNPKAVAIVKADGSVPVVSAASIVAKVARDNFMTEQSKLFPDYEFEAHVGYGTQRHIEALQLHGPCVLHRRSYKPIQKYMVML